MRLMRIKKIDSNSGITMVALVITIIVIVILATVTITTALSQNGILTRTQTAVEAAKFDAVQEEVHLAWLGIQIEGKSNNWTINDKLDQLMIELNSEDTSVSYVLDDFNEENIIISYKGYEFSLGIDGEPIQTEGYKYKGDYALNGKEYLDTGINLFDEENIGRNFEISFSIKNIEAGNKDKATIFSSMDEDRSPFYGFDLKVNKSGNKLVPKIESNSPVNSNGDVSIPDSVTSVRLVRLNYKLYYSFDGSELSELNDFSTISSTNNIPALTFGNGFRANGQPYTDRYFKGIINNISIKFISNMVTVDSYNKNHGSVAYTADKLDEGMSVLFEQKAAKTFDGVSDKIVINELKPFENADALNKNFSVSFKIEDIDDSSVSQASLLNAKLEDQSLNYPGMVYRITTEPDPAKRSLELGFKGGSKDYSIKYNMKYMIGKTVKISRIDRKIYMSVDNSDPICHCDFTKFTKYHDIPLSIGSALKENNGQLEIFRPFKGRLSNIVVKVAE